MMAAHQVLILKEAQEMKTLKELDKYIEKPLKTTILAICHKYKKFDSRTKFGKLLKKKAFVFESKKLYDNQLPDWIKQFLKEKGFAILPAATSLITEYLGTDLSKVVNELEKLVINLPAGTKITDKHIQEHIGISKDYNVFELQKALGQRQASKAQQIINYFGANPRKNPMVVIIASLYNYFSKIYMLHFLKKATNQELMKSLRVNSSFFLKEYRQTAHNYNRRQTEQVLSLLKTYDLKSKGVNFNNVSTSENELMKEMIWQILNA